MPMHTAMRLAMRAAAGVRRARPELPVVLLLGVIFLVIAKPF